MTLLHEFQIVMKNGQYFWRTGLRSAMRFVNHNYSEVDYIMDGDERIEKEAFVIRK